MPFTGCESFSPTWISVVTSTRVISARSGSSSAQIQEKVIAARNIQRERYSGSSIYSNAAMSERQLQEFCKPDKEAGGG